MSSDLKILEDLTEEEKLAVNEIIKEISKNGKSDDLTNLYYEDYEEIPVDLETFLCSPIYLGNYTNNGKDIYETWKKELAYVHNPATFCDQWAITGSTGTGKSTVATYSLCYELYKLMCLKNPNRFYLNADETIWILFFNLNLKLAEKTMWGKFQKALQKSPWFMERGTIKGRTNLVYQPNKDIRLDIGSTEEHALSVAVMYVAIDEMSFGDNDNVDYLQAGMMQIYNQLYLRLSSRFSRGGKIMGRMYLISSAKSTNAVLESFIRDNEGQPGMHVSRYKQWEVLPENRFSDRSTWFKLAVGNELLSSFIMGHPTEEEVKEAEMKGYNVIDVPSELLHRFEMDMNRTLIDTCGIAVQSSYKYIPYRIVEPCIGKQENPFIEEIIKTGLGDSKQIKDFFDSSKIPEILYKKKIYIHCDLSKSGDRTGISAVAVLGYKNQEHFTDQGEQSTMKEIVFRHVFTVGLQCPANDELSMIKVKDFIHYLKYDLGWNIVGVSCDGYQSLMLLQHLKIDHFNANEVSMDIIKNKECVGYTIFRNTLVEQRIRLIKLPELFKEITSLEKNDDTGKVDHPRQCLVGNTKIRMLDGTAKTINELLIDSQNNIPNYVYTFNETTKHIEPQLIKNVWQTGIRNDLYKITLDNNEEIICTGNHPFMLRDGKYIDAQNLQVGSSLMPLYTKYSEKGLNDYRLYYEPVEEQWHYEHVMFDPNRKLYKNKNGFITHHANYNKKDNRPCNLKYISRSKHRAIHNRARPMEENLRRSKTLSEWHKNNKYTELYKERSKKLSKAAHEQYIRQGLHIPNYKELSEKSKKSMSRSNQNIYTNGVVRKYFKKSDVIPEGFYRYSIKKQELAYIRKQIKMLNNKTNLLQKQMKNYLNKQRKLLNINIKQLNKAFQRCRLQIEKEEFNKLYPNYSGRQTVRAKRPNKLKRNTQINNLKNVLKKVAYCKMNNKKYNELSEQELYRAATKFRNILRPEIQKNGIQAIKNRCWYTNGFNNIYIKETDEIPNGYYRGRTMPVKEYKNHKVLKIEKLTTYQKVYDLEIENNHNFALDAGVFVHNSVKIVNGETIKSVGKDESDSLGGAIYNATMSVNMNELDLLSAEILTSDTTLLNSKMSIGEKYFGFTSGGLYNLQQPLEKSIDEELDNIINQESLQEKKLIDNYKETNKNTKLSDTEIKSMINGMYNSDLIIM